MKIYIWGTGKLAKQYMKKGETSKYDLLGFIQSKRTEKNWNSMNVFEPQEIRNTEYDYILVCVAYETRNIMSLCEKLGISLSKVIFLDNLEWLDGNAMKVLPGVLTKKINMEQDNCMIEEYFPELWKMMEQRETLATRCKVIRGNGYDLVEKNCLMQSRSFADKEYQHDYCRYRTFELVANEIIRAGISGNCAEVGVFRGSFAKLINAKFKNRKMYLFDTFSSFDEAEFNKEKEAGNCEADFFDAFADTSVREVLDNMLYPEQCIPKVGIFPETTKGLEDESYAFVSIDVDFEQSILEGLRYFYPRLEPGGSIFVHDYNNYFLGGVKKAVNTYEREIGSTLSKVPLADEGGTLVVVK
ncbi:MAG: TylF/MycF family methyltransferase [Roseburia sp.]|nr:TylF/MycF family methyltransferase [Roseburia sp.]